LLANGPLITLNVKDHVIATNSVIIGVAIETGME
jgi:hypothetical protein